jgi:hypothetical protein
MVRHIESSNRLPPLLTTACFCVTLAPACAPRPDVALEDDGYTVHDSSGVSIVESSLPAWTEGEGWTLTEEPLVSIGAVDGPDEYILYRAGVPIRLEDGRIVVANGGSQEIRFYDSDGRYLNASGSDGEGPGEFRSVGNIWRLGSDSLAVLDYRLYRLSVFDTDGVFGRVIRLGEGPKGLPFPSGMFEDGTILALASEEDDGEYDGDLGSIRDRVQHRRYDREGRFMRSLVTLDGSELYRATHPDGSGFTTSPQHGLRAWSVAGSDTWFFGASEAYEVQEWSLDAELLRIIRLEKDRRAMPTGVVAEWEERLNNMNPQAKQLWVSIPLPERLPAYEQILLDRAGNLWMGEYVVLDETPLWQVVDPRGRWLGEVAMPPGGRISEIGEDYVLGTWRNDMDVQMVRMYGLVKPTHRKAPERG